MLSISRISQNDNIVIEFHSNWCLIRIVVLIEFLESGHFKLEVPWIIKKKKLSDEGSKTIIQQYLLKIIGQLSVGFLDVWLRYCQREMLLTLWFRFALFWFSLRNEIKREGREKI